MDEATRAGGEELLTGVLVKVAPLAPVLANTDGALGFAPQCLRHLVVLLGRYFGAVLAEVAKIFLQRVARAGARLNASTRGQVGFPAQGLDHLCPVVAGDFPQVDEVRIHFHLGHMAHRKHQRLDQKPALELKARLRPAAADPFGGDEADGARLKKIRQLAGELGRGREQGRRVADEELLEIDFARQGAATIGNAQAMGANLRQIGAVGQSAEEKVRSAHHDSIHPKQRTQIPVPSDGVLTALPPCAPIGIGVAVGHIEGKSPARALLNCAAACQGLQGDIFSERIYFYLGKGRVRGLGIDQNPYVLQQIVSSIRRGLLAAAPHPRRFPHQRLHIVRHHGLVNGLGRAAY